jgi:hypothetical protein
LEAERRAGELLRETAEAKRANRLFRGYWAKSTLARSGMKTALVLAIAACVAGCTKTTFYSRPGGTAQQANADLYQCKRENVMPGEAARLAITYDEDMVKQCMAARGYTMTER